MSAAEKIAWTTVEPSRWTDICALHPEEWVCLIEVEHEQDGSIRSARVVGHHQSIKEALKQVDSWSSHPVVTYSHTGGRKLRFPRVARTDAVREFV